MRDLSRAVEVTDRIYWVGAIDWNMRDFHGYETGRGSTYNAYLVIADKVTLVDTVKAPFREEFLSRIRSVIDPAGIDYIITNHAEMDHSGSLVETAALVRPESIFASKMGKKAIEEHFHAGLDIVEVKDGERVDIGGVHARFYETRMLHWPDSMFSYIEEEGLLFSQDAFGMHLASMERFDDEIPETVLENEAAKYYANILMPYSHLVTRLAARLGELGLEPRIIAPDHGPIWRERIPWILDLYGKWARRETRDKAVVVYDTMWGSTDRMARAVADGLSAGGTGVKMMKMRAAHRSDVATELLDAAALVVGSPTINNNVFPTIADILTYVKGLTPKGLVGAAFGSYGWSGEAVKQIEAVLDEMKVDRVEGIRARYVPDEEAIAACFELGKRVSAKIKEKAGA